MNRRRFLKLASATSLYGSAQGLAQGVSSTLEPWRPGMFDIHHLAYGRGNSTLILGPDGTTLLIDAGATSDSTNVSCIQKPNAQVRPGQWIASYVQRQILPAGRRELDYALITHIHPDHLGDLGGGDPSSPKGDYRLTGITDVDALVPIRKLIDRGFPDYSYPALDSPFSTGAPFALNYFAYVKPRGRSGSARCMGKEEHSERGVLRHHLDGICRQGSVGSYARGV